MSRAFDDSSMQYLTFVGAYSGGEPFTLAGWMYTDDTGIFETIISIADNSADINYYSLQTLSSNGTIIAQSRSAATNAFAETSTTYSANTWHHVCGVFASTTDRRVYLDGGGKGTDTTLSNVNDGNVDRTSVGVIDRLTTANYWSGYIAEVATWTIALSDAEVAMLANGLSPLLVRPDSLNLYYPLIGKTDPEIELIFGGNLSLVNSPTTAAHPPIIYPGGPRYVLAEAPVAPPAAAAYRRRLIFALGGI